MKAKSVGDKVRILDGSKIYGYTGHWIKDMANYVGKEVTVSCIQYDKRYSGVTRVGYAFEEVPYKWDERGLEAVKKFKVGDKVIAKNGAPYGVTTNGWKGTVVGTRDNPNGYLISIGNDIEVKDNDYNSSYSVKSKYFDLVPECNQKIVITSDGKTTRARLYDGDKVVKTAEAKCNPSDEFNFETGAKLAFERLFEEKPKFKAGDKVRIIGNTGIYHYYEIGDVVTVKRVEHNGNLDCIKSDGHRQYIFPADVELVTFDCEAFKAGKICVKATKDNFKDFVAEAKKHGLRFKHNEDFDPFNDMCDFFVRRLDDNIDVKDNEIYILCEDDALKCLHYREGKEFVW